MKFLSKESFDLENRPLNLYHVDEPHQAHQIESNNTSNIIINDIKKQFLNKNQKLSLADKSHIKINFLYKFKSK